MRSKPIALVTFTLLLLALFLIAQRGMGQSSAVRLITQPVDDSKMVVLKGNVYPLARAEFDRGAAPASLPMERMLLVLKRSPAQEAALATFLAQQLDPSSANYHQWLTPGQFGERFGASQDDIAQVTAWLQSQGFQVAGASHGRGVIEFSGDAGQVGQAFHTSIHSYVVNNQQHYANATDPSIPAALTPAVAGVLSLYNFPKHAMNRYAGTFRKSPNSSKAEPVNPQYTFPGGCFGSGTECYALGPTDFATIYNITPVWNAGITGAGVTIAIVGDSNISVSDVNAFRTLFGLPSNPPTVVVTGANPGIQSCNDNGDECEAVIDTEWSGAVAKGAAIKLVISTTTNATFGGDLASVDIIDNNLAPIMSESFSQCEAFLGAGTPTELGTNAFYNSLWQQGASQGITIIVSTGDNGSAGCDQDIPATQGQPAVAQPATQGLAVNGVASTPFNVAVGGTDFNQITDPTNFWNSTNASGTSSSAKSYIPETTWNDSCTNLVYGLDFVGFSTNPETNCNTAADASIIGPIGGSGGASSVYSKPSWQTGTGVPADGRRDMPDVSMFAGDGLSGSFYIVCESDLNPNNAACNLTANGFTDFSGFGGTSVSTQTFAGVMALINQKAGRQGNVNPALYALAAKQSTSACNSSAPASTCVFYDTTVGTNSAPCEFGVSPNCTRTDSSDTIGSLTGYNAGTGYDLTTGLGSMNVANLVNSFTASTGGVGSFTVGPAGGTATVSSPGSSTTYALTVTGTNGFAGTVTFSCTGLPADAFCSATPATLSATTTSATSTLTITTTASTALLPPAPGVGGIANHTAPLLARSSQRLLAPTLAMLLICAAVFFFAPKNSTRRATAVFALLVFGMVFIASCGGSSGGGGGGGGSTGTPTGTSTVTVTASSGGTTSATTFTLTVD
jgi:subtilase family serine protease